MERLDPIVELRRLCEGAKQLPAVETSDSWLMHQGIPLRDQAIEALYADPEIGPHLQRDTFLHIPVAGGVGLDTPVNLLRGLLRAVLPLPATQWYDEICRFVELLRLRDGQAPCTVKLGLSGMTLQASPLPLADGALRHLGPDDFFSPEAAAAPVTVVYEYRTMVPAKIGGTQTGFSPLDVIEVETEHRRRATRLLLSLALETSAPVQEQMVLRVVDFVGAGGGLQPRPLAALARPKSEIDRPTADKVAACFAELDGTDLTQTTVAVRRLLLARTERVRPEDQIIDYSIALESMTQEKWGKPQGEELAKLLTTLGEAPEEVEDQHKAFRDARKEIVHDGVIPAQAEFMARLGQRLVELSLRARAGLSARET